MKQNKLYIRRREWKVVLAIVAAVIITASILYTNQLVNHFAKQDIKQINMWVQAVQTHADAMKSSDEFYKSVETQERKRMELLGMAYRGFTSDKDDRNADIYRQIIMSNVSIPIVIVDHNNRIVFSANLPTNQQGKQYFDAEMQQIYSKYNPILINIGGGRQQRLYYTESIIYTELTDMLEQLFNSFLNDITTNAVSAPVIIMNEDMTRILAYGNLDSTRMTNADYVNHQLNIMRQHHTPIEIDIINQGKAFVFYRASDLLVQMRYYPVIQIIVIILFVIILFIFFGNIRKSEQNQVWAGMAKETAHQIGTPLSSLMGWVELLKMQDQPFEGTEEMEKDLERLQNITERFSKIGSIPQLEPNNVVEVVNNTFNYMKKRFSSRFEFVVILPPDKPEIILPLNASLFSWVLENLIKNAIDAMGDKGTITLELKDEADRICIDLSDTGKGIHKSAYKQIFNPGYTSKKRGWGLGLSLAKRIIEEYHKGKIYVKSSNIGRGTTFRISMRKNKK